MLGMQLHLVVCKLAGDMSVSLQVSDGCAKGRIGLPLLLGMCVHTATKGQVVYWYIVIRKNIRAHTFLYAQKLHVILYYCTLESG